MKCFGLLLLSLVFCLELRAADPWGPKVSMQDGWRWTGLEFLNDYEIIHATKGGDDAVWFVHQGGILFYDGRATRNHPIPRLASQSIRDIRSLSDGRVLVTTDSELIVWQDGHHQAFKSPDAGMFIRYGIAERPDGRVLVATQTGIYEFKGEGLYKIETGQEVVDAMLIDARGNLWMGAAGRSIEVYALTVIAGNLVPDLRNKVAGRPWWQKTTSCVMNRSPRFTGNRPIHP